MRCPRCSSYDIDLIEWLPDGRRHLVCETCDHQWQHGDARPVVVAKDSRAALRDRFPSAEALPDGTRERLEAAKADFLSRRPRPAENVAAYWVKYQQVFSRDGLQACDPADLKAFANTSTGANPGNMAAFNSAWKEMGEAEAARRTRGSIDYLLYGPESTPLEDRLTLLIRGGPDVGMPGFRESLLTKVLCVVQAERFLPILRYATAGGGKRELGKVVAGLDLPAPESVNWTIGRLAVWSNDLLLEVVGDGFVNNVHAAEFLWEQWERRRDESRRV